MEKFKCWLENLKTIHHRATARFLQRREWVVFHLPKQARNCRDGFCWLKLYEEQVK